MTSSRRSAIVRLLETRDDHLAARARPLSTLGFVHRTAFRESCPDCLANDRPRFGCVTCGGRGYVEGRRVKDPYDSGMSAGWFGSSQAAHEASAARDAELARLAGQTAPPASEASLLAAARPEGWEAARAEAWARFDYAALDVALDELRLVDERAYRELHVAVVYRLRAPVGALLERGLAFLDGRLPVPLRAPREPKPVAPAVPLDGKARDREIRRLVREGAAAQWVAGRFGLSVSQVYRVAGLTSTKEAK